MPALFGRTAIGNAARTRPVRLIVTGVVVLVVAAVSGEAGAQETIPTADLAIVSISSDAQHARVGDEVTFTIVAINNGPDIVSTLDVTASQTDPSLQLVDEECQEVSADTPACEYSGHGTGVAPGLPLTSTVTTLVVAAGSKFATLTACVSSEQPINDPVSSNDCTSMTIKIIGRRKP